MKRSWLLAMVLIIAVTTSAFAASPTISSLTPNTGAVGSSVVIAGSNFGTNKSKATVTFNGTTGTITSLNSTSITATVPSGATTGNVVVTVSGTASNGVTFTVTGAPSISSLTPNTGAVGSSIVIAGSNFGPSQGNGKVTFGSSSATISNWSASSITAAVPSGLANGNVSAVVTAAGGVASSGVTFTVTAAPNISGLSSNSGAVGSSVTISGTNFGPSQGNGGVTFNGTAATVTSWLTGQVQVTVPTGASTGNIVVTAAGLVASNGVAFTVAPIINSLSTSSGEPGASVTIGGNNFTSTTGSVTFNGQSATISSWSNTSIGVKVPNGATSGNIIVTAGSLQSNGVSFTVLVPTISRLSSTSGSPGASVTISGSNFGGSAGTVTFNGQSATTSAWADGSITTTVPSGATTGNVVVSNGGLTSNGVAFTVAPIINSLSTSSGEPGTSVTISGTNFTSTTGSVTFNGASATISSWSNTSIGVKVPNGATNGNVVVTAGSLQSNGVTFTVLAPAINSLSLTSGEPGASITISGINFGSSAGTVTFNGKTASTSNWADGSITAIVPSGASSGNVVVSNGGLTSNGVSFTVLVPTINSLNPSSGEPFTSFTISGSNFGSSTGTATLNGQTISLNSWSDTSISANVPPSGTSGNVVVTNGGLQSNGVAFTVLNPVITGLSLGSGSPGTAVTISGTSFTFNGAASGVTFNGQAAASINSWSDTSIVAVVPNGATTGNIVVTNAAGTQSNGVLFTVSPIINSLSALNVEPGASMTIAGLNFTSSQGTVTVNGQSAVISSWSNTSIAIVVPNGVAGGNVIVTAGSLSSNPAFLGVLRPGIASLGPAAGNIGDTITISGNHFGSGAGSVAFNGTTASVSGWSDTSITVTVPSGATTGSVVVSSGGFQSNPVWFVVGPYIAGAVPGNGVQGTSVTLNGYNFGANFGSANFNGHDASLSTWSNTSIGATVPPSPSTGPLSVTTFNGLTGPGPIFVVPTVNNAWDQADIGTVGAAGSTSVNGSAYTISAYSANVGGTADSMHYLFQAASGDFDIVVRTTYQTETDRNFQYGITVRSSLAASDLSFSCLYQPETGGGAWAWRTTVNGSGVDQVFGIGSSNPEWLWLRHYGNAFFCLNSSDGSTWLVGTSTNPPVLPMGPNVLVGFSVMSDNETLSQVTFDNISITPVTGALPSPWLQQDLGGAIGSGDAVYSGNVFTLASVSTSFFSAASDTLHYVFQPASGDVNVIAHVTWQARDDVGTYAGIMIRQSLAPDDLQASCAVGYGQSNRGYDVNRTQAGHANVPGEYSSPEGTPGWIQLRREGALVNCYASTDGVNWTLENGTEVNMSSNIEVGLFNSSDSTLNLAKFDSVSLSGVAGVPGPWQQADVGGFTAPGDVTVSNNVFTVESNSYDISGTSDSFHYVYQQANGDLNIIARTTWQQPGTSGHAKAGVMVRQSLDPADLQVSCLDEDGEGLMYARQSHGGNIQGNQNPTGEPLWLKLNRHGNSFTCYISTDGNTWTQLGSSTVNMTSNVYAGLAQSGYNGAYSVANFDNVNLQANIPTVSITYPVNGSTVYLSQPVTLTVNATASPGASVNSVQYFDGQNSLGQVTSAPFSLNIGVPAKGVHTYTAQVTDSAGLTAVSFADTATMSNPQITGVTPSYGKAGTQVKITGVGFGPAGSGGTVNFNGVPADITGWNNGEIDAIVPSGAGYGPIGVNWPDGASGDNAPPFGPCSGGQQNCVIDVVASPAAILADGQHSFSMTITTAEPTGGVQVAPKFGGCQAPSFDFWWPGMPGSGGCWNNAGSSSFVVAESPFGSVPNSSVAMVNAALPCSLFGCPDPGVTIPVTIIGSGQTNGSTESGPCTDCSDVGQPINVKTGNTWIPQHDYSLPGLGGGISITRTWNSQWATTGPLVEAGMFGDSWRASYEDRIQTTSSGATYWLDDGKVWRFSSNNGTYSLTSPIDAHGTLAYNSSSQQYTLTFVNGTQKVFNNSGYLTQVIDRNGNTTNLTYDGSNHLIQIADPANRTLTFAYGDNNNPNQVTSMQDAVGVVATYTYDSASHLTQIKYADNSQVNYTYDSNGLITNVTDALEKVLESHTYDSQRRGLTSQLANGVEAVSVSYPQAGHSITFDSAGNSTNYGYSQIGGEKNFITSVSGPGCATCGLRGFQQFTYDTNGNVIASFDSNGVPTLFTYDGNGNMTSRSTPLNGHLVTWQYTYNNFGELLTSTDPLGNVTTNAYDAKGNLLTVTTPAPDSQTAPSVTTFAYDTKGELTSITDPLNNQTALAYYATGLLHTVTDAKSNVTTFNYDQRGNRTDVYDALNNHTQFAYDPRNRLTGITNPDTSTAGFAYDTRGRRTSVTDGNGKVTQYAYDDANRLTSVTDANTNATQYAYDLESNLTSITDANNHTTSFQYDTQQHLTQTTFPSTLVEKYTYDNVGNLMTKTDRKSQTISYAYDTLDRLIGKSYPDSTSVAYTYDDASRLTQVQDPTGTYSFIYDSMGRLKQTTTAYSFVSGNPFTMVYGYDAGSNRKTLTDPSNAQTTYTYDTLNRLINILDFNNNNFGFGYDALSRRTKLTRPNGVKTSYSYDTVSNLLSVLHQQGVSTLDGASYTYDSAGNRESKTNLLNSNTSNFSYDNVYQLTAVTGSSPESYTYDPVGNRLSSQSIANYSYSNSNELTSTSAASYTYDNNGNTLTKTASSSTTQYTWDFDNRLISVQPTSGGVVTFKYDPFGRRIQKAGASTTNYVYDGANVIEEVDSSENLLAKYSQGVGIDEPLSELRSSAVSYYEQDGVGSVTSLSNIGGSLANTYVYDSFGNLTSSTGTLANPYQYTGRDYDPETGLRYYRARYYDSAAGRLLSEDPLRWLGADIGFYKYVGNSPAGVRDPSGLCLVVVKYERVWGWLPVWHSLIVTSDYANRSPSMGFRAGPGEDGNILGIYDAWQKYFVDYEKEPHQTPPCSILVDNDEPCTKYNLMFEQVLDQINQDKIPYRNRSTNSNAATTEMIQGAGLPIPTPPVWVPGWGVSLAPFANAPRPGPGSPVGGGGGGALPR